MIRKTILTKPELYNLSDRLLDAGIITWRQLDRVRRGQSTYVNGRNRTPEELLTLLEAKHV